MRHLISIFVLSFIFIIPSASFSKGIIFNVRNAKSNVSLGGAVIDLSRCGLKYQTCSADGTCKVEFEQGFECYVTISKVGYTESSFRISSAGMKSENKTITVFLTPTGHPIGGLLQASNPAAVSGIKVIVINMADGEVDETYTDEQGYYTVSVKPQTNYLVKYYKDDKELFQRKIYTGYEIDEKALGTLTVDDQLKFAAPTTQAPRPTGNSKYVDKGVVPSKLPVFDDQPVGDNGNSKYTIQIKLVNSAEPDLTEDKKRTEGIGNLFVVSESGLNKLRIGYYGSEKEAVVAKDALNVKGYGDAFVIRPSLARENPSKPENATPGTISNIKIRVESYKHGTEANLEPFKAYGTPEVIKIGNYDIVLIGGFSSKEEARKVREALVKKGYTGAMLVYEKGGMLETIE